MAAGGEGDARKVVLAAMAGNGAIAIAKFVAAFFSGSVAMLAEAVHSVADTCNQGLLLLGMGLAERHDPARYPMGRAKESYFWPFIVSLLLFFMGGVYAIYQGAHKLGQPAGESHSQLVPVIVLSVSMLFEGGSFLVAAREFNRARGKRPLAQALFRGKDPTIPVVLLEDTGAMLGLAIALVAVVVSWVTGSTVADAVGSIVIGVLLCIIGVVLAHDTRSLLLGESATPEMRVKAREIIERTDGVEAVTQMLTMHMGPDSIVVALKVRFRAGTSVEQVEQITDELEARVRAELPQMKRIFVEPDSDYDAKLDAAHDGEI